uniref:CHK kinase-like domain-containing protein n=2 Tax=Clastoptera arizonana TaxID=38151 RepID=A0A1B6EG20_9HEMI
MISMEKLGENLPWLNNEFLASILQEGDESKVITELSFSAHEVVPAGNNYCSTLTRLCMDFKENGRRAGKTLIVKSPLPEGPGKKIIDETGVLVKESLIYNKLIPLIEEQVGKMFAKSYRCEIPDTIILEDLKEGGYAMMDRLEQLDFEHSNKIVEALAKFHAVSVHVEKQKPELIEEVGKEVFFIDNNTEASKYFAESLKWFAAELKEWEGFEQYAERVGNSIETLLRRAIEVYNSKRHIRVLNHGDAWTNNILFKHDADNKIVDIKLIDLQMCRFASPGIDLNSFIVSTVREDVKRDRLPELFATYLCHFNSTLDALGCDERLTAQQLQDELEFCQIVQFTVLPGYIAIVLCDKDKATNIDEINDCFNKDENGASNVFTKLYKGDKYRKVATYTLKNLENSGFFDSL